MGANMRQVTANIARLFMIDLTAGLLRMHL